MRRAAALVVLLALAGCAGAEAKGAIPTAPNLDTIPTTVAAGRLPLSPLTPTDPGRLPPNQRAALTALAASSSPLFPSNGHGHTHQGPHDDVALPAEEQARLDRQWATARAASASLDTFEEATAAGYVTASAPAPGVGVHLVKWSLIDEPFDPAAPSMLLFDLRGETPGLVGFSYWLHAGSVPEGFAGSNDEWHQHSGLCIVNGWVDREEVDAPSQCAGEYFGGRDLWMLHAWVVPGHENRWGSFADTNPALCPPVAASPDIARCPGLAPQGG